MDDREAPDVWEVVAEFRKAFADVSRDMRVAFEELAEDVEYRFDKEIGKQLAKHPELYADLKRGYRRLRKGLDETAKNMGLR